MKTQLNLAPLALLSLLILHPSTSLAQGSLTPPGAPAPTMKTLAQIEPRTPISTAPFTISEAGSYYLTSNLTVTSGDAITIASNGVTLDLNGFTIRSTTASAAGHGILIHSGLRNITIANGFIEGGVIGNDGYYYGSGFGNGISYSGNAPENVLVSRVSVVGCLYHGIYLVSSDVNSSVVESCTVRTAGGSGICASAIQQSVATNCGNDAVYGRAVHNCYGSSYSGTGVRATTAENCYGSSEYGDGVVATIAQNCRGHSSVTGVGIEATIAQNCYGSSSIGMGVYATTAQNCYGDSLEGTGVHAKTAVGCYGSGGMTGLYAENAAFCTGQHLGGGTAIEATIANGCYAGAGDVSITYKYNMP